MAAVLAGDNVEEEYLWAATLSAANKELVWDPKSPEGEEGSTGHRLLVKTAILMPEAKEGEVNMVEVEGDGYNGAKVKVPLVAMRGGELQKYVDLLVPTVPATIRLVQGAGPIHLVGSHCVERGAGEEDSEEEDEEEGAGDAEGVEEDGKEKKKHRSADAVMQ